MELYLINYIGKQWIKLKKKLYHISVAVWYPFRRLQTMSLCHEKIINQGSKFNHIQEAVSPKILGAFWNRGQTFFANFGLWIVLKKFLLSSINDKQHSTISDLLLWIADHLFLAMHGFNVSSSGKVDPEMSRSFPMLDNNWLPIILTPKIDRVNKRFAIFLHVSPVPFLGREADSPHEETVPRPRYSRIKR